MATVDYIVACIVAVVVHELGHVFVGTVMGFRIKRIGISWKGPYVVRDQGPPLANLCTAVAGPLSNLVLAALCWNVAPHLVLVNLALGGYNLLPFIRGLDGCHALAAYRELRAVRSLARASELRPSDSGYTAPVNAKSAA